ncbi:choice-of-anchor D domain-containing protein [Tamlana sp. s12]|uniref:LamG-like jellyroll fold domain-containing protein n=1 Tax=Tamlana sp. s12 TaxID=1630406 RepID=UPI0007FE646F|nr:LamG-like jellyroll fold domain-containing protein [Tamlana sp. s12]OBQ55055.1 hypothetical protein VQ01_09980 [Tamlana sp. s12]QQY83166.1 choice-of-anchor D domain-containing protein [Tamlana sp. s12]
MKNFTLTKYFLFTFFVLMAHVGLQAQTMEYNTPGTYTYTVPTGIMSIKVETWGAGGAGASTTNNPEQRGAGGGGGAYASSTLTVAPGDTYTVVVGAGGYGTIGATGTARDGKNSTFGTTSPNQVVAAGGLGAQQSNVAGAAGGKVNSSIGTIRFNAGNGGRGSNNVNHALSAGGGGAAGPNGVGGNGGAAANNAPGGTANGGVSPTSSGVGGHGVDPYANNGGVLGSLGTYGSNYGGGGAGGGGADQDGGNGAGGFVRVTAIPPTPELQVTGLGNTIQTNNTPSTADNTDFKIVQVGSQSSRTYTIENMGTADLNLGNITVTSGSAEFSIVSSPGNSTIMAGNSAPLEITFLSATENTFNGEITIESNDSNISTGDFILNLQAEVKRIYFDSDGDGVYDDVDEDDDNDGILDADEQGACASGGHILAGATSASYKLLNETFGTGTDRSSSLSNLYNASTTYRNEDGIPPGAGGNIDFSDGEYTVYHQISTSNTNPGAWPNWNTRGDVASYSWYAWGLIEDHTPNDTDGKMAIFNADAFPGVFYEAEIVGVIPNVPIDFGFWVINLDNRDDVILSHGGSVGPNGYRLLPEVRVEFLALDGVTVLDTFEPGEITRCNDGLFPGDSGYNQCNESVWQTFTHNFTTSENSFIVRLSNIGSGGAGNDLAIDDITVNQALCDRDGDGVADLYDLDSDNDGIPDAVEAGLGQYTSGNGILNGPVNTSNGLMTHAGVNPIPDSDGDGIPDYLDLDSDNDGVFDVDEYGGGNNIVTTFQHGDGDISGNGVGDGSETETFRERDLDGDGVADAVGFGDGILDIFDFAQGTYGTAGQEPATTVPNYQDPISDGTTLDYTKLDVLDPNLFDASGVLTDNTDADGDGIMDSRDGDNTVFGSPRDLNDSYSLYFDGRNDYVEEPQFLNGTSEGTLMCWVKLDAGVTNAEFIVGQENINFAYRNGIIIADLNGSEVVGVTQSHNGKWIHLALTYSSTDKSVFYVNGEHVGEHSISGLNNIGTGFLIGRTPASPVNFFQGEIDEVRVFSRALTETEVKRMVYQELDEDPSYNFNRGKIIPRDISTASVGASLIRYYKMDGYKDDILDNKTTPAIDTTGATIYNAKDILFQTAPLPYVTTSSGNWSDPTVWEHGDVWDITTKMDNPDAASIIQVKNGHALVMNGTYDTQGTVGVLVESGGKITVKQDKGLFNTWYTKLDGILDIEGESQFIQKEGSELDAASAGFLEIDQQGTKDLYTYNYWGSPVGKQASGTNNTGFTLADVLYDGTLSTDSNKPNVNFTSSGYNGSPSPLTLADYWVYKFVNGTADEYYAWKQVRSTGTIDVGEGFSLKGSDDTATSFNETQNYSFRGMPNNGDITLKIDPGNEYLIGNPYPSAMDAETFIKDNISAPQGVNTQNVINGALYFWHHFANKTHLLREYEGGYATYNLVGSAEAVSNDPLINASGKKGGKPPGQFIPVAQGFFVAAIADSNLTPPTGLTGTINGGNIVFKNSQRVFETESGGNSVFFKEGATKKSAQTNSAKIDNREKIKLRFESSAGINRQLLVGVDSLASSGFNIGYDAPLIEDFSEDMYWYFVNSKFVIQGTDSFDESVVLPLGVKVAQQGLVSMSIDSLQNIDAAKNIYLYDKFKDVYHDLRVSDYEVNLSAGEYLDRFALTFSKQAVLATQEELEANFGITYANNEKALIIKNPKNMAVTSVAVYSSLGQLIHRFNEEDDDARIVKSLSHLSQGAYLVKVSTEQGVVAKMIVVN